MFVSIKSYPERVKKAMVRQHHCCILPLRAHCNHQYPRACNKGFKSHTTSSKKAIERQKDTIKDLLHQNYHLTIHSLRRKSTQVVRWWSNIYYVTVTLLIKKKKKTKKTFCLLLNVSTQKVKLYQELVMSTFTV